MKETTYLDPNFYVVSDIMNYTIRGEVVLREAVDGTMLQKAVETAMKRFPYFCLRIVKQGEELVAEPNPLPHKVLHTDEKLTLGTEEVNYHIAVVSYFGNSIFFAQHNRRCRKGAPHEIRALLLPEREIPAG